MIHKMTKIPQFFVIFLKDIRTYGWVCFGVAFAFENISTNRNLYGIRNRYVLWFLKGHLFQDKWVILKYSPRLPLKLCCSVSFVVYTLSGLFSNYWRVTLLEILCWKYLMKKDSNTICSFMQIKLLFFLTPLSNPSSE